MDEVRVGNRRDGGWWWRLPVLGVLWLCVAAPIVVGLFVAMTLRSWARDLPEVPDLAAWRTGAPRTSRMFAADGSLLAELPFQDGKVFGHRELVPLEALPKVLVDAVLAAEDVRFDEHHGVDYPAIARAAWINYHAGRVVEGASTITQQVARNLLPVEIGTARNLRRKVREALLARDIERRWTKHDILETYLDFVFLGEGAYGMVAAARAYFDRDVADVDLAEAALLAGLIQAPGRLDPFHHLDAARARRDEILARMARAGMIDEATRAAAVASPIALRRPPPSYGARVPWYTEQVRGQVAAALGDDAAKGGLVVETAALPALGTELQARAVEHTDRWATAGSAASRSPEVGAIVLDHTTGYVEAIVGGRSWGAKDRFDRFVQSCRQPGSAWKPMVYGAALAAGAITPGTPLRDAPIAEYDEATNTHWKPKSGNKFRGVVLAEDAFAASLNAPAIDVFDRVGAPAVIAFARRLGITTAISELRPMALGASCVKPIELARAYAVIARRGVALAPAADASCAASHTCGLAGGFVVRVRRGDAVLYDAAAIEDPWLDPARRLDRIAATAGGARTERLLDEPVAFQLAEMMAAVTSRGTAAAAASLGRPSAGKTGTTNDNTDAWFLGFTGRVVAAVWVGFDAQTAKLGSDGDGAHAALPLWLTAVRAAEGERPRVAVPGTPPQGMEQAVIDRETGLLAAPHTGGLEVWFRHGTAPTEVAGQPGTSSSDFGRTAREF